LIDVGNNWLREKELPLDDDDGPKSRALLLVAAIRAKEGGGTGGESVVNAETFGVRSETRRIATRDGRIVRNFKFGGGSVGGVAVFVMVR